MYFCQQEVQVPITTDAGNSIQSVNLTGFRAGEVQRIILWLTPSSGSFNENTPGSGGFAPLQWSAINDVTLTYNGEIFSRFDGGSAPLWALSADEKSASYSNVRQTPGSVANTTLVSSWVECPFAQVCVPYDKEMKLVHGKPILNAVVNLQFRAPTASASFVLHAMYLYNSSLLCSRGSSEYIF
jgi:hypothetical protein